MLLQSRRCNYQPTLFLGRCGVSLHLRPSPLGAKIAGFGVRPDPGGKSRSERREVRWTSGEMLRISSQRRQRKDVGDRQTTKKVGERQVDNHGLLSHSSGVCSRPLFQGQETKALPTPGKEEVAKKSEDAPRILGYLDGTRALKPQDRQPVPVEEVHVGKGCRTGRPRQGSSSIVPSVPRFEWRVCIARLKGWAVTRWLLRYHSSRRMPSFPRLALVAHPSVQIRRALALACAVVLHPKSGQEPAREKVVYVP
jgi:hypothetical protein